MKNAIYSVRYKFQLHSIVSILVCLFLTLASSACSQGSQVTPPPIIPGRPCTLSPGESLPLVVDWRGEPATFEWSASGGTVIPDKGLAVNFTAPHSPGQVVVIVNVIMKNSTIQGQITCTIEATPVPSPTFTNTPTETSTPLPTSTSIPTATITPTPVLPPIACNHPSITKQVFPQFEQVAGQFPFAGSGPNAVSSDVFLCQGVYDQAHTPPLSVKIVYHSTGDQYGFFGFGIKLKDGFSPYDASKFTKICLWDYTEVPGQAFRLKLKDASGVERGIQIIIDKGSEWTQISKELSEFTGQGVNLSRLENINLGFEQVSGSATLWVDDFELK